MEQLYKSDAHGNSYAYNTQYRGGNAEPSSFHSPERRVYELGSGSGWEVLRCSLTALFLASLCSLMALCIDQLLDRKEGQQPWLPGHTGRVRLIQVKEIV